MALFRRNNNGADPQPSEESSPSSDSGPSTGSGSGAAKKDRPTPTRKEAEAARRERVHKTMNKREARAASAKANRADRMKAMAARDNTPEKSLLRDYVDSRWNIGEFLLPSLVVILALTFLNSVWPIVTLISTVAMYLFIALVLFDIFLMWRGYKKLLAVRHPRSATKGLLMYGMNRCIQIRRFRIPAPRIKRGEEF